MENIFDEIVSEAGKGALTGAVFGASDAVSAPLSGAAKTAVKLGTVGGGTYTVERLFGAKPEQPRSRRL